MAHIKCKLRMQIITKLISNLMCDHTFATESSRRCCVLCRMMMNRLWKYDVTSYKYECYEMWWGNRVVAELEPEIFNSTWPETALGRVRHTKRVFPASISSLIHLCSSCPNCVSRMCGVRAWVAWLVRFAQQQGHQVGHSRGSWLTYLEIPKQRLKHYVQGKFLYFWKHLKRVVCWNIEICMQNPWSSLMTAK